MINSIGMNLPTLRIISSTIDSIRIPLVNKFIAKPYYDSLQIWYLWTLHFILLLVYHIFYRTLTIFNSIYALLTTHFYLFLLLFRILLPIIWIYILPCFMHQFCNFLNIYCFSQLLLLYSFIFYFILLFSYAKT